jgi:hypothetical protein
LETQRDAEDPLLQLHGFMASRAIRFSLFYDRESALEDALRLQSNNTGFAPRRNPSVFLIDKFFRAVGFAARNSR